MKNKSTWIFLIFVAALGAFAIWDVQSAKVAEEKKTQDSLLVPFQADQVQSLSIQAKNQKIILDKTIDGWKILSPLEDWADSVTVDEFVSQLTKQKSISTISKIPTDLSIYGLEAPAGEISVTHQNKQVISYEVGGQRTVEQNTYLRKKDSSQVIVASPDWVTWIHKSPSEFRDRRLLRGKISAISEVEIKTPKGEFKLEKRDNAWILAGQPDVHQDQNRIREMLKQITMTKGQDVIAERNISDATQLKYGIKTPQVRLRIKHGDKTWQAAISENKDKSVYAMTSDPIFLLRLEEGFFERLKYLKKSSFKDRKEIFAFNPESVRQIGFQTALKRQSITLKDSQWVLDSDGGRLAQDKITAFLEGLKKLGLSDFVDRPKAFKVENKIGLKDEKGQKIFEFSWASFGKAKIDDVEKDVAVAKTSLSPDLFYIEQSEIDKLKLAELIPTK